MFTAKQIEAHDYIFNMLVKQLSLYHYLELQFYIRIL